MKKIFSMILATLLIVATLTALVSCGDGDGKKVKIINIKLTEEQYAFAVNQNDTELLTAVNELMAEIKANGKFTEITDKYFRGVGEPTGITSAAENTSKDQLVVATNAAFAPFEYMEGDKFYGIDMEIMALLAQKLNKELVIKNMDFDATILDVQAGNSDIVAAGLTYSEARAEIVTFSDTYYDASQVIIVKEGDTTFDACGSLEQVEAILNTLTASDKVGVQRGTTGQLYMEGDADWGFAGYAATVMSYDNAAQAVQDMLNGNIKLVVVDEAPANVIVSNINGN